MIKFIKNFRKDEDGAVMVDWVVLTVAAYTSIETATTGLTASTATYIGSQAPN